MINSQKIPINFRRKWTETTKKCYQRGCVCTGCPTFALVKRLSSINRCLVKVAVIELITAYGKPEGVEIKQFVEEG